MFEKAIEYTLMIKSWDDLVDPQTLAFYITLVLTCLLTSYAASTLKEKRVSIKLVSIDPLAYTWIFFFSKCFLLVEMTTKFNKGMYAKMRSKKDEPLSNIRKNGVRPLLQLPLPLPSSPMLRLQGRSLQPLRLKRSLLLQKGRT